MFFLAGVPIIIGVVGYKLIDGEPIVKRALVGLVPMFALVWVLLFLDIEDFWGVAMLHAMLIGLIVIQAWEIIEGCFRFIKKRLIKSRQ